MAEKQRTGSNFQLLMEDHRLEFGAGVDIGYVIYTLMARCYDVASRSTQAIMLISSLSRVCRSLCRLIVAEPIRADLIQVLGLLTRVDADHGAVPTATAADC